MSGVGTRRGQHRVLPLGSERLGGAGLPSVGGSLEAQPCIPRRPGCQAVAPPRGRCQHAAARRGREGRAREGRGREGGRRPKGRAHEGRAHERRGGRGAERRAGAGRAGRARAGGAVVVPREAGRGAGHGRRPGHPQRGGAPGGACRRALVSGGRRLLVGGRRRLSGSVARLLEQEALQPLLTHDRGLRAGACALRAAWRRRLTERPARESRLLSGRRRRRRCGSGS